MTKQKAIDLIKKLLALANPKRNSNAAEREAAFKKAHEIAAKHGIKITQKGKADTSTPKAATPKMAKKPAEPQIRRSTVEKPTKVVWQIMKKMSGAKRKDILEACRQAGIAKFTATTQYQAHKARLAAYVRTGVDEDEGGDE